jgi:hypothetical protein
MTANAQPPTESAPTRVRSDVANWARAAATLPGQRPLGAIQGFGKLWQKTTRVRLEGATVSPEEVVSIWKAHFPEFWPPKQATFHAPLTGIAPGEVAALELRAPGGLKLSTGVMVLYADEESFTFMTPEGHMLAGWITFSAFRDGDCTVAQTQILMRAQDPIGELGLTLGGHRMEERFWEQTLVNLAARFDVSTVATTETVCVDPRRQWRRAGNIRHDIMIRSTVRTFGAPFRWLRGRRAERS